MTRWLVGVGLVVALAAAAPASAQDAELAARAASIRARVDALSGVPDGARLGLRYMASLEPRARARRAEPWMARAERYLDAAEAGRDPYLTEARGEITLRAYRSAISELPQGYAVYVPPDYDPSRRYPLLVALHGGSSNGNLFLALTLGARVPRAQYRRRWWTMHEPARTPDWIVVAPEGFGNSMWRFMGERDVLDVIDDVAQHYSVDADRVVLHGLSNGGLGSYNIGTRHAWRFAAVVPLAGAPGWVHYLGGHPSPHDLRVLRPLSAWHLIENARNTHLHAHHGHTDPGPMRPRYVSALERQTGSLAVPFTCDWYTDAGHDLVGPVHRAGRIFEREAPRRRDPAPSRVTLVTGDYRAARQHWLEVTRIGGYPSLVRLDGERDGDLVRVRTEGRVEALALHDVGARAAEIDGTRIALRGAGHVRHFVRGPRGWRAGRPVERGKRPGVSGPLGDALLGRMIHVYGTGGEHPEILREAAEAGARGWIENLRGVRQPVLADTELTPELAASAHVVLYGGPESNAVLARIADRLPIRVEAAGVRVGGTLHPGRHLGVRFLAPSPFAPGRYVVVQGASRPETVRAGNRLAAFLPDWVVYDARRLPDPAGNLPTGRSRHVAAGFFDDDWRLSPRVASAGTTRPRAPAAR